MTTGSQPEVVEGEVSIAIDPAAGAIGTSHQVTVSGLEPGETVTLAVLFGGSVEYNTDRVADENGTVSINLVADAGDPAGIYTVNVMQGTISLATADFEVQATDTVVTPPQSAGEPFVITDQLSGNEPDMIEYEGTAGDVVSITLISDDFDTYLILQDDTGIELSFDDDGAGDLNSQISPYILPYTGTYTIVVTSFSGVSGEGESSGSYTLEVTSLALTQLPVGQSQTTAFSPDNTTVVFSIDAAVGDILDVTVSGDQAIDTILTLTDPSGIVVLEDDDGGEGLNPEIASYTVLTPGTYYLELRTFDDNMSGNASILLEKIEPLELNDSGQSITVTGKQPVNVVNIQVDAGQHVFVNIAQVDGNSSVTIEAVQNSVVLMSYTGQAIPDGTRPGFVAPEAGFVSIIISGDYVGSATIDLSIGE